jgi:hypothetical protein
VRLHRHARLVGPRLTKKHPSTSKQRVDALGVVGRGDLLQRGWEKSGTQIGGANGARRVSTRHRRQVGRLLSAVMARLGIGTRGLGWAVGNTKSVKCRGWDGPFRGAMHGDLLARPHDRQRPARLRWPAQRRTRIAPALAGRRTPEAGKEQGDTRGKNSPAHPRKE